MPNAIGRDSRKYYLEKEANAWILAGKVKELSKSETKV
jgi:hypothetical protein